MERLDSRYLPANLVEGEVEVSSEPKRVIGYAVHTFAEEPLSTERRTLVFLPGMGFAGRFSGPYKYNKLLEFGVRLIVVERPGYGKSTPDPNRTLLSYAEDLNVVIKTLNLPRCHFIAHSAGCHHLLAFCHQHPERVVSAAIMSPPNPLVGPEAPEEPTFGRSVQKWMVVTFPGFMSWVMSKAMAGWVDDPAKFVADSRSQIMAGKDIDFVNKNPELEKKMAYQFSLSVKKENVPSVLLDFQLTSRDWGFQLRKIKASRLSVWFGDKDNVAPNGKAVAELIPNADAHQLSDFGHGIIYSHWDVVMDYMFNREDDLHTYTI